MVITFLKVEVFNPQNPKNSKEYKFFVDSGAVYSVMLIEALEKLIIALPYNSPHCLII